MYTPEINPERAIAEKEGPASLPPATGALNSCIRSLEIFLNGADSAENRMTIGSVREELEARPSIDQALFSDMLRRRNGEVRYKNSFTTKVIIPEIRAGRYDGHGESVHLSVKTPLSSWGLFKKLREIGVREDVEMARIDWYLDAVWMGTDITIDEIRHFTEKAVEWMEAHPRESRKVSVFLQLCQKSSTLSKHMEPGKAMEAMEKTEREFRKLDEEYNEFLENLI